MYISLPSGIFPPDIGGPATYVPAIAAALVERGHKVSIITLSDLANDDSHYPFIVHRIRRGLPKWQRIPLTVRTIVKDARQADVIFTNGLFVESALAARLTRKPLVIKIVGDWAWEQSAGRGWVNDTIDVFQCRRYDARVEGLKKLRAVITRQADVVITPSNYLKRIVMGWGIRSEQLRVIYNAEQPAPAVEPISLPPFDGATVITVARLVLWKGIDRLLQVVASLSQVRLLIVGKGPERMSLESLASSLDLGHRVIFTGQVAREKVPAYLRAADVFVLNSTYEGLPHIVLEAMQAGLPVIATDVGGTGELIRHQVNGLLIQPNDNAGLRSALQQILASQDKRVELTESGHRTATVDFSFNEMVSYTEGLLTDVNQVGK